MHVMSRWISRPKKIKPHLPGQKKEDRILLEKLALEGLISRYGENKVAEERVARELRIIQRNGLQRLLLIIT